MTTLIDGVVGRAGAHTSKLGLFCNALANGYKYANFQQKITSDTSCRMYQIFHCSKVSDEIFCWKLAYLEPRALRNIPDLELAVRPHPCPFINYFYQGSHCSTLLIGCLNLSGSDNFFGKFLEFHKVTDSVGNIDTNNNAKIFTLVYYIPSKCKDGRFLKVLREKFIKKVICWGPVYVV